MCCLVLRPDDSKKNHHEEVFEGECRQKVMRYMVVEGVDKTAIITSVIQVMMAAVVMGTSSATSIARKTWPLRLRADDIEAHAAGITYIALCRSQRPHTSRPL